MYGWQLESGVAADICFLYVVMLALIIDSGGALVFFFLCLTCGLFNCLAWHAFPPHKFLFIVPSIFKQKSLYPVLSNNNQLATPNTCVMLYI